MKKEIKQTSFELSLERLETLVDSMESGEATLEQSLEWFEEGMSLIKSCQDQLKHADKKVQELIKIREGEIIERDFE